MEIILKRETSLGLESYEDLGFNSEEEFELEISKLIKNRPELETNGEWLIAVQEVNVSFNIIYPLIVSFDLIIPSQLLNTH